jgi:putative membrane protein
MHLLNSRRVTPVVVFLASFGALAQSPANSDSTFQAATLQNLHAANVMEIGAGKLAKSKGTTPQVRAYGAQLVTDHTAADKQVTAVAKKLGVTLSKPPPDDSLKALGALKGTAFDTSFINMMIQDHDKAIAMVKDAQGRNTNPDLAALLNALLPSLEKHRATAAALAKAS